MSPRPRPEAPDAPAQLQRRVDELSALYEVARALIGTHDVPHIASRAVLTVMGQLGVRSGGMFAIDERGRYRLLHGEFGDDLEPRSLQVSNPIREWMLRNGAFALRNPTART